jgi:hypothetical protein
MASAPVPMHHIICGPTFKRMDASCIHVAAPLSSWIGDSANLFRLSRLLLRSQAYSKLADYCGTTRVPKGSPM